MKPIQTASSKNGKFKVYVYREKNGTFTVAEDSTKRQGGQTMLMGHDDLFLAVDDARARLSAYDLNNA